MAKSFRPTVSYNQSGRQRTFSMPSYTEVKKNMKEYLMDSEEGEVSVYRHRRGEWGEWFEHWGRDSKYKPIIIRQGWM